MKGASRTYVVGFFLILGVAAGLRFWGLDAGLPHLMTRPDEEVLLLKTRLPASGQLDLQYHIRHPGVPAAYIFLLWGVGEVGLPVMQALGYAPPGDYLRALERFPARLLLLERMWSAFAGIAAVGALMWYVRRELGERAALASGVLLAASFLHVRESHSAKPDAALSFFAILALGLLARLAYDGATRTAVKSGAAIGFGMAMKPPAVLLFLPAWIAGVWSSPSRGWRRLFPTKSIIVGLVAIGIFVATSPDVLLNEETRRQLVNIVYVVFPEFDPNPAPEPTVPIEERPVGEGYAYYYDFAYRYGAGWLLYLVTPLAVVWGFASRTPLGVLSAAFTVVGFVIFAGSTAFQARYLVPLLPAAAALLGGMLTAATERLVPDRRQALALAGLVAILVAEPLWASIQFDRVVSRTDTRVLATSWVRQQIPEGSVVGVAGTVFWSWGEPWMPPNVKRVQTTLDEDTLDEAGVQYLVTHDHPLFASTIDPAALARLEPRLRLLTEFDPFVLPADQAQFDVQDAYYVPMAGLDAVDRPGPIVRIYELTGSAGRP